MERIYTDRMRIVGTGAYLPDERVGNDRFIGVELHSYDSAGKILESRVLDEEGVLSRTGGIIERRRASKDNTLESMGIRAAINAIENAKIDRNYIKGIVVSKLDYGNGSPSIASKIQAGLGLERCNFAYDINNACAGFPEALSILQARVIQEELNGYYLAVSTELLTPHLDYSDINAMLFGDGAGAAVLGKSDGNDPRGILAVYSESYASNGNCDAIFFDKEKKLRMPGGKKIFGLAIDSMERSVSILRQKCGWEDLSIVIVPHQANGRITEILRERLGGEDTVYSNIERYGNMSSASCPVALHEALEEKVIQEGSRVILTSFGAGVVASSAAMQF